VRVLSFGAGVQSSALLLMADRGEIEPVDFAVFADTGAEPYEVLTWLEKLRGIVKTPIHVAQKGNIETEVIEHWAGKRKRCGQPPLYAIDTEGKPAMLSRHCTKEYKIEVVDREIKDRLGVARKARMNQVVEIVIGISFDERQRMTAPREKWKRHSYPLVDRGWYRGHCIEYVQSLGIGTPPRSACHFCPYKSNMEWRRLRDEHPEDWKRAVGFDEQIRRSTLPSLSSEFFVHRSMVPLAEADLDDPDANQMSLLDECSGMCGV
jgi:hypothetical protein